MNHPEPTICAVKNYLQNLQNEIAHALITEDPTAKVSEDLWDHPQGGGGRTWVIAQGAVFEKGAVNFSHIHGRQLPPAATARNPGLTGRDFQALGVSLVLHPFNPHVPTVHLNVRFFIAEGPESTKVWWFGGGFDLTPYYGYTQDCRHWHQNAHKACEAFGADVYPRFKKACDDYFYLPHRNEPRGIGGLFFDDMKTPDFNTCFAMTQSIGNHFLPGYLPIVQRRKNHSFTPRERDFQCYRRGRYVEFNLLYDRGTLFGIQSGGRTESILISLPPQVNWRYQWVPEPGSAEESLYQDFLVAKDWLF